MPSVASPPGSRRSCERPAVNPAPSGLDAVAAVRAALEPGRDRVRDHADGFTWRPDAFEQRVTVVHSRDDGSCRVEACTAILREVVGRGPEFAVLAARNAREPGMSSLRWDAMSGDVSLIAAVVARPGDGGRAARRLAHAALLQLGDALLAADELALELPAASLAEVPDAAGALAPPVAAVHAWRAYAAGATRSSTQLPEHVAKLVTLAPAPWRRATRAVHGVDAEIDCAPHAAGLAPGARLALLRVSALQPHPRLGAGLMLALVPPESSEPIAERAAATAALLNEGEAREWMGVDALGGWCVHPAAGLSHVVFVPALAVEQDTVETLAIEAAARARWAVEFLARVAERRTGATPTTA